MGETMKMNPVVHFEMPYENQKRMIDFYTQAFGWQSHVLGPEMGNYVTVSTAETDQKTGFPKKPGSINGGLFEKSPDNQHPSVVIAVDDIYAAIKQVEAAGGKIIGGQSQPGQPDDIPGIGLYSAFVDTEGNRVSMLQPTQM